MDPLTALSTAGTVLQFVDFGSKLIDASVKLYKKGELDVHEQAKSATDDILDYTVKLRRSLLQSDGSTTPPELTEDEELLKSICEECDELARDLLERLKKLSVPQDKKGAEKIWPTLTAAFKSTWKKEDLRDIQERLDRYRGAIDSRVIQYFR
jgi:polyhydroxyalkanoate synthesis regulator phasin